jgi:anti-anti-sigma factor
MLVRREPSDVETLDGGIAWDGHLALVHATEEQRRRGMSTWVHRGLDTGAKILLFEQPHEARNRSVLTMLGRAETDEALASGQLRVVPATEETYSPAWRASMVDEALAEGYRGLRLAGDASTGWDVIAPDTHAASERSVDRLCRTGPVSALCLYPSGLLESTLARVFALHGNGIRESQLKISSINGGVALEGSVDASNARVLREVLGAVATTVGRPGALLVALRELAFLDVVGSRALDQGTRRLRDAGGRVLLSDPQRLVERVLRLLGVDRLTGVELEANGHG